MALPVKWVSRDEFLHKYVARFRDLKGSDTGLPDSEIKGHYKMILNVFGFEPPGAHSADTNSWRITPSICSDLISDRDTPRRQAKLVRHLPRDGVAPAARGGDVFQAGVYGSGQLERVLATLR